MRLNACAQKNMIRLNVMANWADRPLKVIKLKNQKKRVQDALRSKCASVNTLINARLANFFFNAQSQNIAQQC